MSYSKEIEKIQNEYDNKLRMFFFNTYKEVLEFIPNLKNIEMELNSDYDDNGGSSWSINFICVYFNNHNTIILCNECSLKEPCNECDDENDFTVLNEDQINKLIELKEFLYDNVNIINSINAENLIEYIFLNEPFSIENMNKFNNKSYYISTKLENRNNSLTKELFQEILKVIDLKKFSYQDLKYTLNYCYRFNISDKEDYYVKIIDIIKIKWFHFINEFEEIKAKYNDI